MKTRTKAFLLILCAVMLVVGSVAGTLAYLTSNATVENTFTVGQVEITLAETKVDEYGKALTGAEAGTTDSGNEYKLLPGHTYIKDPTITVGADSEDCWLFAKIENGLGANADINVLSGWTQIGATDYWAYANTVSAGDEVTVFDTFTYSDAVDDTAADAAKAIVVTAYAIQADSFSTSEAAWTALSGQLNLN